MPLSPRSRFRAATILAMAADELQIFVFPLFAEGSHPLMTCSILRFVNQGCPIATSEVWAALVANTEC
jgi:hypothetical protein